MASVFHANRVTQKAPIAWQKDRNTRKPRVNDQVLCQYRSSLPEGIPSGKPHPHFPCVVIDDSNIKGVTEAVVDGIEAVVDEVHYNRNPQDSDRNTYSVRLGNQRADLMSFFTRMTCFSFVVNTG
eukprot:gb/GECG01010580.1/.p1 GENE.gb/GECG01010580.1/~~gb/GECG01010580.1/.p1  ORF type:complete len:125 (+),score=6.62 gb/GECG01010580.1/:1-375(+)